MLSTDSKTPETNYIFSVLVSDLFFMTSDNPSLKGMRCVPTAQSLTVNRATCVSRLNNAKKLLSYLKLFLVSKKLCFYDKVSVKLNFQTLSLVKFMKKESLMFARSVSYE